MLSIIKEYVLLIVLAALAIVLVIWYLRKQGTDAAAAISATVKQYGEDTTTVKQALTTTSGWRDIYGIFKTTKYISPADQKAALAEINAKMFKK